ncbi:cytochrome b [Altererythrobacter arenosus]|uniref:Cytochrome b n=1 Tax=Altererythrobacter arenosus TaxID=3032592 RepID=A0ABY8FVV7_9SPHN|nr:cytochrome b [Altererythrobacter sp. CAU 1644]WFL77536.1 cytochrome b [Altererythrobacter sp. CAU 1644]
MSEAAQARYSTGAMLFHWIIAILVIVNWRIAEAAEHLEGAEKAATIAPHKAIGITILVLTLLRLGWRLTHKAPPMSNLVPAWQRTLAKSVHVIFYVMLIGLPIGGWLAGSYADSPVNYFGLFTLPTAPVEQNYDQAKAIIDLHAAGGEAMIYLIGLHILGALKHTFIDKVNGIGRMLPFGRT